MSFRMSWLWKGEIIYYALTIYFYIIEIKIKGYRIFPRTEVKRVLGSDMRLKKTCAKPAIYLNIQDK